MPHNGAASSRDTRHTYSASSASQGPALQQTPLSKDGAEGDHRMLPEWMHGHLRVAHLVKLCNTLNGVQLTRPKTNADGSTTKNIGNHYSPYEVDLYPAATLFTKGHNKGDRYITIGISAYEGVYDGFHIYRRISPACYKLQDVNTLFQEIYERVYRHGLLIASAAHEAGELEAEAGLYVGDQYVTIVVPAQRADHAFDLRCQRANCKRKATVWERQSKQYEVEMYCLLRMCEGPEPKQVPGTLFCL